MTVRGRILQLQNQQTNVNHKGVWNHIVWDEKSTYEQDNAEIKILS